MCFCLRQVQPNGLLRRSYHNPVCISFLPHAWHTPRPSLIHIAFGHCCNMWLTFHVILRVVKAEGCTQPGHNKSRFTNSMPCPCRAAKCLEFVFPIWFTQCGRVWFTLAIPCPCHALTMPFFSIPQHRDGRAVLWSWEERHDRSMAWAWAWHGKCESDTAALCKSNGKDILNPYRRGMAGERHGRGMGTAYYVWIGLNKFQQKLIW